MNVEVSETKFVSFIELSACEHFMTHTHLNPQLARWVYWELATVVIRKVMVCYVVCKFIEFGLIDAVSVICADVCGCLL